MKVNSRAQLSVDFKLLAIHRLIASGIFPSSEAMAREVEVSRRTIVRYLDALRNCGAPLQYDARRRGWAFKDPFWQLPALRITEGDLLAFFIAEQSLRLMGQDESAQRLRQSLSRLACLLPKDVSISLAELSAGVTFENQPFATVDPHVLESIARAAIDQRTVTFNYYSPHSRSRTSRKADVHQLHNAGGDWYAISYDRGKRAFRDFHVARISNLKSTEEFFDRQEGWNPDTHLRSGFNMMRGGIATRVEIVFDSFQAQWIRERRNFHPEELREELSDGGLRLSFSIGEDGLEAVARFCLMYAGNCVAVAPPKLRALIKGKLDAAAKAYED